MNTQRAGRARRWSMALALVVVVALGGLLLLRHFLHADHLTTLLASEVRSRLGAELVTRGNADFGFLPKLHLHLASVSLAASDAATPFLVADGIDVVVPWRTLWSGEYVIERIDLDAPRLDLDALDAWLATRPAGAPGNAVSFALRANDARIVSGGNTIAEGISADISGNRDLAAWLDDFGGTATAAELVPPLDGAMHAARIDAGGTRIEGLDIRIDEAPAANRAEAVPAQGPSKPSSNTTSDAPGS
jgi:hypothetical protein